MRKKAWPNTVERLSSGQRVDFAASVSAGAVVANRMTPNLRAHSTVGSGINGEISLMQVTEDGLDEINDLLLLRRPLAAHAATEMLSNSDRASSDAECKLLHDELPITTEAFSKYALAPATALVQKVQLGHTAQ
ncbi:hypothetical protein CR159_20505 [Pollutimonas subterranea]|uniref:Flagellin N-terminal domain-containing protein n=1 Tax=Pollutimonas subterranea TaxID=2045210 RepID=A0A2N4TYY5_9BURK|nr:hypothetical protein [Pollutimonas subterranea]PLC47981.1 hypothetical protein CR159_20505 [Pollutimonas subterranea]